MEKRLKPKVSINSGPEDVEAKNYGRSSASHLCTSAMKEKPHSPSGFWMMYPHFALEDHRMNQSDDGKGKLVIPQPIWEDNFELPIRLDCPVDSPPFSSPIHTEAMILSPGRHILKAQGKLIEYLKQLRAENANLLLWSSPLWPLLHNSPLATVAHRRARLQIAEDLIASKVGGSSDGNLFPKMSLVFIGNKNQLHHR